MTAGDVWEMRLTTQMSFDESSARALLSASFLHAIIFAYCTKMHYVAPMYLKRNNIAK